MISRIIAFRRGLNNNIDYYGLYYKLPVQF